MSSFVLELEHLSGDADPPTSELITEVEVSDEFIDQMTAAFGTQLESEDSVVPDIGLQDLCEGIWHNDTGNSEIYERVRAFSEGLHSEQKAEKGLLFHSTESEILVSHFRTSEGWIYDTNDLINGDRIDNDSIISIFVLSEADNEEGTILVDVDYYTESLTFMEQFDVLSEDKLTQVPYNQVYLKGSPVYDDRYDVRYSLDRDRCVEMVANESLELDIDENQFTVEQSVGSENRRLTYSYQSGRFGFTGNDDIGKFKRDWYKYRFGCLTSRRLYNYRIDEKQDYAESRHEIDIPEIDESIVKRENADSRLDVVFNNPSHSGKIKQDFADEIIRSIRAGGEYHIYLASHRDYTPDRTLHLNSNENELVFTNIKEQDVENKEKVQRLYRQAIDDSLNNQRRLQIARGIIAAVEESADTAAANSLVAIRSATGISAPDEMIQQLLNETASPEQFIQRVNAYFDEIGAETRTASLVSDGFTREDYDRLLQIIDEAGRELENAAGDFSSLDEEGYRSVLTSNISTRINRRITREAETSSGPADMRLYSDTGDIIYLGECKRWYSNNTGVENNVPLDQMADYDLGQEFNSIIIFYESQDYEMGLTDVLDKVDNRLNEHSEECERLEDVGSRTGTRLYKIPLEEGGDARFVSLHIYDVGHGEENEANTDTGQVSA
jgi:hypothetical protein